MGGGNPYGYVSNPLGWIDPLGLAKNKGGGTPKDAQKKVNRGQGPREIERIDNPKPNDVPGSQWHAHDQNGGALNLDGSIHDKCPNFPNKVLRWLQDHGWNMDNWL